jgi:hypothetical protein
LAAEQPFKAEGNHGCCEQAGIETRVGHPATWAQNSARNLDQASSLHPIAPFMRRLRPTGPAGKSMADFQIGETDTYESHMARRQAD